MHVKVATPGHKLRLKFSGFAVKLV